MAAREFRVRPSNLLAIEDPVLALNFDLAGFGVLQRIKEAEAEEILNRR